MKNTQALESIFAQSKPGNRAVRFPNCDVPAERPLEELIPSQYLASTPLPRSETTLPELSEIDVVRHFSNLPMLNMSVDTHFYPLGSCTMKYNPKRNETLSASPKLQGIHPYQPQVSIQDQLRILHELHPRCPLLALLWNMFLLR